MHPFQYVLGLFFAAWAMGAVFDIYNTVTGSTKWLRWLRPALDLVFWVFSAVFIFLILYHTDSGRLRLYVFLLLAAGYAAYRVFLHRAVVRSAFTVVRLVRGLARLIWWTVDILALRPVRAILYLVWRLTRTIYRMLCRVEDLVFWVTGQVWRWTCGWWWNRLTRRPRVQKFTRTARHRWEGFWSRASNWIRKHPTQV